MERHYLHKGIEAEDYVIEQITQEFKDDEINIIRKKTCGRDLTVYLDDLKVKIEVKSCERFITWYCKKRGKNYTKSGAFAIHSHQVKPHWLYAFVIRYDDSLEHFFLSGEDLIDYLKDKKPVKCHRIYVSPFLKLNLKKFIKPLI